MALTAKQGRFVEAYLISSNATQAALDAGYSPRTACAIGWENLRKPEIANAIKQRTGETAMLADEVLKRLAEIARGDMGDFLTVSGQDIVIDLSRAANTKKTGIIRRVTQRMTTRTYGDAVTKDVVVAIELVDPLLALQLIGRHHKLFTDKTEVTGAIEYKDADESSRRIIGRLDSLAARLGAAGGPERGSTDREG